MNVIDPLIPPEATIRVWTCAWCGWKSLRAPSDAGWHPTPTGGSACGQRPVERVYVDLAAVDREAWAKRIGGAFGVYSYPEGSTGRQSGERTARAVVDDLLGPEDKP